MATSNTEYDLLTIAGAAETASISGSYLPTLLQSRAGLRIIWLGRRVIIRREALLAWLVSREASYAQAA